ncbi:hypothetical protein BP5796_01834 [Coleophoma crateriformis]|uniref:Uncharacterized protein n=1 Tax=Coleophoma crateriformis TaxID=565419 RepID=A0A3D8T1N4_9HELO|nr:hypothetical protein BP5796_01834 [Coleophoma crateriformis]
MANGERQMDLTPIKVPGKRHIDKSKAAIFARKTLKRRPGRPLKLVATKRPLNDAISLPSMPRGAKKMKRDKLPAVKRSHLENTPGEILAEIFLYSMNFALPATSPHLALQLNDPVVYRKTITMAFGSTWNAWIAHSDKFPFPAGHQSVNLDRGTSLHPNTDRPGDHVLQTRVLKCAWVNVDVMVGAKELWLKKKAAAGLSSRIHIEIPVKAERTLRASLKATYYGEKTLVPTGESYSAAFEKDYQNFCEAVEKGEDYMRLCNWDKYVDVHYRTEIPSRLLTGPWTEGDIRLLFWLVRGGACIQFGQESTTAEAARDGFYQAVETGEVRVMVLFDWMKAVYKPNMIRICLNIPKDARGVRIFDRMLHHGRKEDRPLKTKDNFFRLEISALDTRGCLDLPETDLELREWFAVLEDRWDYFH